MAKVGRCADMARSFRRGRGDGRSGSAVTGGVQPDRVLRVYVGHYNTQRPHRALELQPPIPEGRRATPTLGKSTGATDSADLVHEYYRLAA
jgi:hypothetical protein